MSDLIGKNVDRYHIIEQLGQGGMARVFKAYDTRLEREVALKFIRTEMIGVALLSDLLKRFEREGRSLARLDHPHIVKIHDYGEYNQAPYLVMQYLPGGTLKTLIGRPMPYAQAAQLLAPIARALAYAHEMDILHRDVKPANILLTKRNQPILTDFGIAKILAAPTEPSLTNTEVSLGTPEYMAPEQWTGQFAPQGDIYALGVIFYELVTGQKPYTADTPGAILIKQMNDPLPRPRTLVPDLPETVEWVLFKALDKDPANRYASAGDFAAVLERLVLDAEKEAVPVTPIPPMAPPPMPKPQTRRGWVWGALVGVGLLLGLGLLWVNRPQAQISVPTDFPPPTVMPATLVVPTSTSISIPITPTLAASTATLPEPTVVPTPVLVQLTTDSGDNTQPAFAPDGQQIVFISTRDGNHEVYLMDANGQNQRRLTDTPQVEEDLPSFAPDGQSLIFGGRNAQSEDLYLLRLADGQILNLTNSPQSNEGRPRFSPSGAFVVFDADRSGNWEIYLARLQTGQLVETQQLTHRPDFINRFAMVFPLGDRIVFRAELNAGVTHSSQLYEMSLDGSNLKRLSAATEVADFYPVVAPGGLWIVFVSNRSGNAEVYALNPARAQLVQLTQDTAEDSTPAFAPDEKTLVFASNRVGGVFNLFSLALTLPEP